MNDNTYSEKLKKIRQELKMSIEDLSKIIDIPARTIGGYERNERNCSIEILAQMCKKLNVNANWFLTGNGEMFNTKQPSVPDSELEQKVVEVMKKYGVIEKWVLRFLQKVYMLYLFRMFLSVRLIPILKDS